MKANIQQVLAELKKAADEQTKKTMLRHGAKEPIYGTKVEHIKKIMKTIKDDQQALALELFASGVSEAQYMAGLMAHGAEMTTKQLQSWIDTALWSGISEYSVPWVACENDNAIEIALKWIDSKKPEVAACGWNTLSGVVATWADEDLDIPQFKKFTKAQGLIFAKTVDDWLESRNTPRVKRNRTSTREAGIVAFAFHGPTRD